MKNQLYKQYILTTLEIIANTSLGDNFRGVCTYTYIHTHFPTRKYKGFVNSLTLAMKICEFMAFS